MEEVHVTNTDAEINVTIEEMNESERIKYLPVTVVLVVIMCVGIVGNILVLFIYKRKFKRSSARVYILSLAMADLTVCVFGIPYHVLDLTLILTYTNVTLCKVLSYFIGGFTMSSIFILLVVGLDRYLKVCRPLKRQIVDFGDRKACLLAVFFATIVSIPNGIIYGHSSVYTGQNNITGVECFIDDEYQGSALAFGYLGLTFLICIVSVLLLIIMYALICRTIYQNDATSGEISLDKRKVCFCCFVENNDEDEEEVVNEDEQIEMETLNENSNGLKRSRSNAARKSAKARDKSFNRRETMIRHSGVKVHEKNTRKITLMMMTITVVFIIAYLPYIFISVMDNLDETFWDNLTNTKALLLDLLLRLYLLNNAANPLIYSFWDIKFRKETKRVLRNIFCCWKEFKDETKRDRNTSNWSSVASRNTSNWSSVASKLTLDTVK